MNNMISKSLILIGVMVLFVGHEANGKSIDVRVYLPPSAPTFQSVMKVYNVDDEKTTIRQLGQIFLEDNNISEKQEELKLMSKYQTPFGLDQTLKEVGVEDDALLFIKY